MCSCFSIGYCLDNNYMYHMTTCKLLLVVCRSWNHNIDAGLCSKSFNVTYSLSTDTLICIYLIIVNKHILFYLSVLTNKINTLYLYYCIQYAILVVLLFFLICQHILMHKSEWKALVFLRRGCIIHWCNSWPIFYLHLSKYRQWVVRKQH